MRGLQHSNVNTLVSIIVTSYNHAAFLPQRMDSLLAQIYPDIEIIVVDDCSTDGSREYLTQFKNHPKISLYFLESNRGYVHSSNYGVSKAKGEYIVFAECDDFSHPDQIGQLYQAITMQNNIGVAFSESNLVNENGKIIGYKSQINSRVFSDYCQKDILIPGLEFQKIMLLNNLIPNMSAAMFRKSLFYKIGGLSDHYQLSADYDFWIRMAGVSDFYHLTMPLNNFRHHSDTVRNHLGNSVLLIEKIDILGHLKKKLILTLKEKIELKMHLGSFWFYYAIHDFHPFRKTLVPVLKNTFRKEPLLLLFLILSFPVIAIKKIAKLLKPTN
jgi:glycosyltransferase involved in cell wall biosynthesis